MNKNGFFYRLDRWVWLKSNKKEPGKKSTLLSLYVLWMVPGLVIGTVYGIIINTDGLVGILALMALGLFFTVATIWAAYDYTRKTFDIDGIYQNALGKWRRKKVAYLEERGENG